jgi:hypothetical protein
VAFGDQESLAIAAILSTKTTGTGSSPVPVAEKAKVQLS